jgi:predicted transcriptional regulator
MKVEDVMTADVVVLRPDMSIDESVRILAEKGISGSPVVDTEGEIIGMLTETDILNALKVKYKKMEMVYPSLSLVSVSFIESLADKEVLEAFKEIASSKVFQLMERDIVTVDKGSELSEVVHMMMLKGVNRIPVMDKGRMVGIVSRADIIKGLAQSDLFESG